MKEKVVENTEAVVEKGKEVVENIMGNSEAKGEEFHDASEEAPEVPSVQVSDEAGKSMEEAGDALKEAGDALKEASPDAEAEAEGISGKIKKKGKKAVKKAADAGETAVDKAGEQVEKIKKKKKCSIL